MISKNLSKIQQNISSLHQMSGIFYNLMVIFDDFLLYKSSLLNFIKKKIIIENHLNEESKQNLLVKTAVSENRQN